MYKQILQSYYTWKDFTSNYFIRSNLNVTIIRCPRSIKTMLIKPSYTSSQTRYCFLNWIYSKKNVVIKTIFIDFRSLLKRSFLSWNIALNAKKREEIFINEFLNYRNNLIFHKSKTFDFLNQDFFWQIIKKKIFWIFR